MAPVSRERIESVIRDGVVAIAWQPIVSLPGREVVGYEAFARFGPAADGEAQSPSEWFRAAEAAGLRDALEVVAARSALAQLDRLPSGVFVGLNVSPVVVGELEEHGDFGEEATANRVVLDFREEAAAGAMNASVSEAVARCRARGVRIALDDTGSGMVSLKQMLGLQADIIKIDTDVTRDVDTDVAKQAVAYALKSLAERSSAMSLAEGVETEAEARMLASLGVEAAQGYLFGRPAPLP